MKRHLIQLTDQPATTTDRNALHRVTFDSLPIELQDEIFFICTSPFPRFSVKEAPIVLARVCRAWRSIVLSTPRLWSSFDVEIQGSDASGLLHDDRLMHRMKLWLERSRSCPLSVRLTYNPVGRVSDDRSTKLLIALAPEVRRWQRAHFALPAASITELRHLPSNSFPTLRSLTLRVTGVRSDPALDIFALNIPWGQLTYVDLQLEPGNLPTLDETLDILSRTVNLKHGTLKLECTWSRRDIQRDKLSLPTLETFQLILQNSSTAADRSAVCLAQFLNLLYLPKLRMLSLGWLVRSNVGSWSLAHAGFLAFLRASAETLRELRMTYFPIPENELRECFLQLPQLTHLDLRFALHEGANDPITNRLLVECTIPSSTVPHSETPLLPRLEHVNLQCHGALYTDATLLGFIQSRWECGMSTHEGQGARRSLRYFRLLSMKPISSGVEKHAEVWHEEGLDIDIQSLVVR